jgi:hypothetical protein
MTAMRSRFWRSFEHGQDLAALFVDFKPMSTDDDMLVAQYAFLARCGAVILLCVVVAGFVVLVRNGHVWSGIAMVGTVVLSTVVQLINQCADH